MTEPTDFVQEEYEIGRCYGVPTVNERFRHPHERRIPLFVLDAENRIANIEDKVVYFKKRVKELDETIAESRKAGMPDHVLTREYRSLEWYHDRISDCEELLVKLREDLDKRLRLPEKHGNVSDFSTHWTDAKNYWEHILDWIVKNEDKLTKERASRLWDKIHHARRKMSISVRHYCTIALYLAKKCNKTDELPRIAQILADAKKRYERNKWSWKPQEPTPVLLDPEEEFFGEASLTEDELITAIDIRRRYRKCRK